MKASSGDSWPSDARTFLRIEYDRKAKRQNYLGPVELNTPNLIYVYVSLADEKAGTGDRFFVLTMKELQQVCIRSYTEWMTPKDWKRPRSSESYDNRFWIPSIAAFENRWSLVLERFAGRAPDPALGAS